MYKAIGVDAKSEFAFEGQKLSQRSLSAKEEKKCTTVKQLYLFICKAISFQAKFCMFIVMSHEHTENIFLKSLNVYLSTLKWGQYSSSATIRAFLQSVFLYFILSKNKKIF